MQCVLNATRATITAITTAATATTTTTAAGDNAGVFHHLPVRASDDPSPAYLRRATPERRPHRLILGDGADSVTLRAIDYRLLVVQPASQPDLCERKGDARDRGCDPFASRSAYREHRN